MSTEPLLTHPSGYVPRTGTLRIYFKAWGSTVLKPKMLELTAEQLKFVDDVYEMCAANYSAGGDTIVEAWEPWEIAKLFKTLNAVREYCGLKVEQETNAREGTDEDPELKRLRAFQAWTKL